MRTQLKSFEIKKARSRPVRTARRETILAGRNGTKQGSDRVGQRPTLPSSGPPDDRAEGSEAVQLDPVDAPIGGFDGEEGRAGRPDANALERDRRDPRGAVGLEGQVGD